MIKILTTKEFSKKTKENPMSIHINPIGLLRMGISNEERFSKFNSFLQEVERENGNVAIPTYSYSFVKNEIYNQNETPSSLDKASEYLRTQNRLKRTSDAMFSYLLFGKSFSNRHFISSNYASFGEDSLIEEIYLKDGYLGAIGGVVEHLTEIHFLERKLNVNYRFDKQFSGVIMDQEGKEEEQVITYYCRDLESDYIPSFLQLKQDLKESNLIEIWKIKEYNLKIEVIKFKDVFNFIKKKVELDSQYLWKQKINKEK